MKPHEKTGSTTAILTVLRCARNAPSGHNQLQTDELLCVQQPLSMGVALPEWLFSKDNKMAPLMLMVLVGCGILLPLSVVSWYMLSSDQYEGPNRIMKGTYYNYLFDPKNCIKESMVRGL
jgi:hypothetical protein